MSSSTSSPIITCVRSTGLAAVGAVGSVVTWFEAVDAVAAGLLQDTEVLPDFPTLSSVLLKLPKTQPMDLPAAAVPVDDAAVPVPCSTTA
jgi:hypothetical protein